MINHARLVDTSVEGLGLQNDSQGERQEGRDGRGAGGISGSLLDDTALFDDAGHGVQIQNENLLVPVDFEPGSTIMLSKFRCFPFNLVIESLKARAYKRSIFILDACRSNPMTESRNCCSRAWRFRRMRRAICW